MEHIGQLELPGKWSPEWLQPARNEIKKVRIIPDTSLQTGFFVLIFV